MTLKRTIIIAIAFILLLSNISFAESDTTMLVQEKNIMRKEIIRLKLLLGKEEKAEKIPVLLYHHILPQEDIEKYDWEDNGSVISLEDFKAQMTYLYENNYHTATMEELDLFIKGELELPKKTVAITFDDGYLSNKIYAYPIMKEYNQKGTIFIWRTSLLPSLEFSPDSLQYICSADKYPDVFDYQSHTFGMHSMKDDKALLEISTYDEIKLDLLLSRGVLNCDYLAYPFGKFNQTTLDVMEELDFKLGFTVNFGYVTSKTPKYELPRIIIYPKTPIEKFISYIS